jgi:hypothetical protein
VVVRCLQKDAALRYRDADQLVEALAGASPTTEAAPEREARDGGGPAPRAVVDRRSALLAIGGAATLGALGFAVGRWSDGSTAAPAAPPEPVTGPGPAPIPAQAPATTPRFTRLSYQAGGIISARFTSDGHSVVFGAAFGDDTLRVHTLRTDTPMPLALDLAGDVLAVSSRGELAVSLGRRLLPVPRHGTLARAPLVGGAARPLLEHVQDADFEADGEELIVSRQVAGKMQLERPVGTVIYQTEGWLSHLRREPLGERLALVVHPFWNDTQGRVAVIEKDGTARMLSETFMDLNGLAWSADGREIHFSGAPLRGPFEIAAVDLDGKRRRLFQGPGRVVLHDIARDGRALVTIDDWRGVALASQPNLPDRDLSVLDCTVVTDFTADGSMALLSEQSAGGGGSYQIYLRPTAGGPPTLLGEGYASSISPSGRLVAAVVVGGEPAIDLIPTGPGTKRRIPCAGLTVLGAFFLGSDERLLMIGSDASDQRRLYVLGTSEGAAPTPISPAAAWLDVWPRSDGDGALAQKPNGEVWSFTAAKETPGKLVATLPAEHTLVRPVSSTSAFVLRRGARPGEVLRLDLTTGKLAHHVTLAPRDLTGFVEASTYVGASSLDRFAYTYFKLLSTLYLLEGL